MDGSFFCFCLLVFVVVLLTNVLKFVIWGCQDSIGIWNNIHRALFRVSSILVRCILSYSNTLLTSPCKFVLQILAGCVHCAARRMNTAQRWVQRRGWIRRVTLISSTNDAVLTNAEQPPLMMTSEWQRQLGLYCDSVRQSGRVTNRSRECPKLTKPVVCFLYSLTDFSFVSQNNYVEMSQMWHFQMWQMLQIKLYSYLNPVA